MTHVLALILTCILGGGGPQTGTGTSDLRVQVVRSPEDGSVLGGVALAGDVVLSLERVAVEHLLATTGGQDGAYTPGGTAGGNPPQVLSDPVYNPISQTMGTVTTTGGTHEKPGDLANRHDWLVEARVKNGIKYCEQRGRDYWEEKAQWERDHNGPDRR